MPPRSGKSELFSRAFPAWAFGKNPNLQIIASSYSSDLSTRMNRDVQRIMMSEKYEEIFPETKLNSKRVVTVTQNALRNSEIFEIVGHTGAYRSAGVGGGITLAWVQILRLLMTLLRTQQKQIVLLLGIECGTGTLQPFTQG